MEGLQICPSSVEITRVGNVSRNTNNEWNEQKKNTRDFVLAHDKGKLGTQGRNDKDETTLCGGNDNEGKKGM